MKINLSKIFLMPIFVALILAGTHSVFTDYAYSENSYADITPTRGTGSITQFATTSGSTTVTVTDAIGCSVTDSVEMPVDPSVLQTGATILQQVSCAGACDAQVTHSPTGGTPPYSSVWTLPF